MKILVTGGNGQLAFCLRDVVKDTDNKFMFLSKDDLDITDAEAINELFEEHLFDVVINCAAYTNVDKARDEVNTALKINEIGPLNLALIAKQYGAKLIHISTDYVFDGENNIPYTTDRKTNPLSTYGYTKLMGEEAIKRFDNVIIIRTSWLYSNYGKNFYKTMLNLIKDGKKTFVVNDQIGTPTYAKDLAGFIYDLISNDLLNKASGNIFHYSNEGCASWYDFAKMIEMLYNPESDVIKPCSTATFNSMAMEQGKIPENRPFYSVLSKKELSKIGDINVRHWAVALRDCMNI